MKVFHIGLLCLIFLSACDNEGSETPFNLDQSGDECSAIKFRKDGNAFPEDPLTITKAAIFNNTLLLTVEYGGGCGDVSFDLIGDSSFMESNPVQTNIVLSFKDNDYCKAIITKQLCFDLRPMATFYKTNYQTSTGTIILHLKGYETALTYSF